MANSVITGLDHVSLLVRDTARALDFYTGILGMMLDDARPDLGYAGAWLQTGNGQIHLIELPNPDPLEGRPVHGGRDRHTALRVSDLDIITAALDAAGISYTLSRSGRRALFCRDFDMNALELVEK